MTNITKNELSLKIAVGQISPRVGALEENFQKIRDLYIKYSANNTIQKADILILPELATCGYLAQDLLLKPAFISDIHKNIEKLVDLTNSTTLLLPTPYLLENKLYNAVLAIRNGQIIGRNFKQQLPNYGIFDEKRYFTSGKPQIIEIDGLKIGVPICEDIWHKEPIEELKSQGAKLLIVPNSSPFERNKHARRIEVVQQRFEETKIPLLYCNQMLGHDGIIFDGKSFCYDGKYKQFAPAFKNSDTIIEFTGNQFQAENIESIPSEIAEIYEAMKLGVRDYVIQNGFQKVILGISGGIDSAIVACICADSLGAENVKGYMLPSKFSSEHSKKDAISLAKNLAIDIEEISISSTVEQLIADTYIKSSDKKFDWQQADITIQNIQSRIRGCILMAKSNSDNALLITTGNKSEYATGYATLYGDMNGAFNPIKDVYKTEIYALANYRNSLKFDIPQNIIDKEPSAELAADQKDSDSLPDYQQLDQILFGYIEENLSLTELCQKFPQGIVEKTINMVNIAEYKRHQSAPGVKISTQEFGRDRRYPLTNGYR